MKRLVLIAAICLLAVSVSAEVVIKTSTHVDMGEVGQMKIDGTEYFAGDKMATVEHSKMSGSMGMNSESEDYTVVRLDKGVQWEYSEGDDVYSERSLGSAEFEGDFETQKEMAAEGYKWETVSKKDLEPMTVVGVKCLGKAISSVGVNTSDPEDTVFINYKYYYSDDFEGVGTVKEFQEKMMEKTGMGANAMMTMGDETSDEFMFSPVFDMAEDLDKIAGYPMRIEMTAAMSKNPMGEMPEEVDEETLAMMEKMGMKMPSYPKDDNGHFLFLNMINEVTSIKEESVDDGKFEVPSGMTKVSD